MRTGTYQPWDYSYCTFCSHGNNYKGEKHLVDEHTSVILPGSNPSTRIFLTPQIKDIIMSALRKCHLYTIWADSVQPTPCATHKQPCNATLVLYFCPAWTEHLFHCWHVYSTLPVFKSVAVYHLQSPTPPPPTGIIWNKQISLSRQIKRA